MSKGAKIIIAVLVVAVIAFGAWWLTKDNDEDNSATEQSSSQGSSDGQGETPTNGQAPNPDNVASTITYDGSGFTISASTIKSNSTVKVVNNSQDVLDFASDPHPVHTDNPELNAGDIDPGQSATVTLTTRGAWGFHNHHSPGQKGTITVE